jgi:hypothetical protein
VGPAAALAVGLQLQVRACLHTKHHRTRESGKAGVILRDDRGSPSHEPQKPTEAPGDLGIAG